MNTPLNPNRIMAAFAVAMLADALQVLLNVGVASVVLSAICFLLIVGVDIVALFLTSRLIGFHWMLLPSMAVELIPGLDILPTWTGCVAYVVWARKNERNSHAQSISAPTPVIEAEVIPARAIPPPLPASVEERLKSLAALHGQKLISDAEYETKRQAILAEL